MTEREARRLALACLADPGDAVCRLALADALEEMGRDASCLRADGRWRIEWRRDRDGRGSHWLAWIAHGMTSRIWVVPLPRRQIPRRRQCVPPCRPLRLSASCRTGWRWTCIVCFRECAGPLAPPPTTGSHPGDCHDLRRTE